VIVVNVTVGQLVGLIHAMLFLTSVMSVGWGKTVVIVVIVIFIAIVVVSLKLLGLGRIPLMLVVVTLILVIMPCHHGWMKIVMICVISCVVTAVGAMIWLEGLLMLISVMI
jgi:hypothetical protein